MLTRTNRGILQAIVKWKDVAKNPNTPVDVLAVLSTDSNAQVRDAVVNR